MRSRDATESTLHDSDIIVQTPYDFVVHVPATEFDDLLEIRAHTSKKNKTKKEVVRLREGWGDWLVEKIRNQERSSCAYQFAGHYVATDESSGSTSGGCKCGGNIKCDIKRTENNIVEIRCNATKGPGQCGKRQLKGETRKILSQRLRGKSVYAVRSEMANELIGDDEEDDSPFLYTSGVMRTVKWQTAASNHIHPDVWISLHLLCLEKMPHEIQYFCAAPFFLHWCTKHQLTVYNKLLNSLDKDHVCLAIDASGRFVKPLPLPNKLTTGPIFLYSIVAKNSTCQVPIAQMLSARHTTVAIQFWLTTWREQGTLPIPKEVVTDRSLALMAACVIAFTRERTVIEYADVFFKELPVVLPTCYIRLDVAHFLKNYRDLLDKVGRPVRQFYLAGLGKLIRCEKRQEAERIIRALLTISSSEGDGPQSNGEESTIQHEKKFMETLLTDEDYEFQSLEESILIERDGTPETQAPEIQPTEMRTQPSEWYNWVTMLNSDVVKKIEQKPGKPRSANAHFFPGFAEKLMADVKYLPLWSCITRNCFGYGRNPASSSQVEGEFKNLRSLLLPSKGYKPPIRADDFIQVYSTHLNGLSKIKRVEIVKKNTADQTTENAPQHFPSTESNEEQDNKTDTEGTIASHSSEDMDISFSSSGMIVMDPLRCPKCLVAIHDDAYCSSPLDESHVTNRKICKFCKQVNPEEFSTDSDTDLHEQGTEHSKADESHGYDSLFPCILSNNDIDRSNTDIRLDYNYASNQKTSSPIVPSIRKKIPSNKRITFSQTNTADNILDISHSSRELENADGDQCRINQFKECVACGEETEDNDKCGFCNFLIHPRDSCSVLYRIQHQVSDVRICFSCEKDLEKAAQYLIGDLDMDLTIDRMDKTPLKISNDRTNFESSAIKPTDELTCPVCKRAVGSAHKCKNCHLPVHAIDICSIPDAEADEGFGQLRICHICSKSKTSMVTGSLVAETNTKCGICQKSGSKMRICILCNYHVHTSGDCSSPCNEDYRGTPQGYICKTCSRTEGSGEFLEMRCLENWMGEAKKSQAQEKRGFI